MKGLVGRLLHCLPSAREWFLEFEKLQEKAVAQEKTLEALQEDISSLRQEAARKDNQIQELQEQRISQEQQRLQDQQIQGDGASMWSSFFYHRLSAQTACTHTFATGTGIVRDDALVRRIINITRCRRNPADNMGYVWDIISLAHSNYVDELDFDRLSMLASSPLADGLLQGRAMTALLHENEQQRNHWSNVALDALLALCEAMELIEIEDVELGVQHRIAEDTPDKLLDAVSRSVGFEVTAPDVFVDLFGLETKRGVFTFRHFIALYVAWRLSGAVPDRKNARIGEIGAGAGLVAYYAWQFGFRDYTIFDLPTVNVVQSWFLGQSLPDAPLILGDEPHPFARQGVRVLSGAHLEQAPESFWDVVVNIDSMPEIAPEIVAGYLERLHSRTRLIYSYNHEARPPLDGLTYLKRPGVYGENSAEYALRQEPMAWHVAHCGGYDRLSRSRAWLRPGYVEEWYEPRVNQVKKQAPFI